MSFSFLIVLHERYRHERSDLINIFFCAILPKLPINVSTQERHREAGERGWKINLKKKYIGKDI